jgi:hypothetical protein
MVGSDGQAAGTIARNLGDEQGLMKTWYYNFTLNANPEPGMAALAAQRIGPKVDFGLVKGWFALCEESHGTHCESSWSNKLLDGTRMIDVESRKIISPLEKCKYVALSTYGDWGGIGPKNGDLEKGTLTKTIEDAITVTPKIGASLSLGKLISAHDLPLLLGRMPDMPHGRCPLRGPENRPGRPNSSQ